VTIVTPVTFDAARAASDTVLDGLVGLHARLFPAHQHVHPEFAEWRDRSGRDQDRIVHLLVTYVDDAPAALLVLHLNLPRRVGLVHFLGVAPDQRAAHTGRPSLAGALLARAWDLCTAAFAGEWLGLVAESEPDLLALWQSWGYTDLSVEYAEPHHGMHWSAFGPPTFFRMELVGRPTSSAPALASAAVEAFLIDHYRLPDGHPVVAAARATARGTAG
jgi:hypothetical protein